MFPLNNTTGAGPTNTGPLEAQVAQLRQQVAQLQALVASTVRQGADGMLVFPKPAKVVIALPHSLEIHAPTMHIGAASSLKLIGGTALQLRGQKLTVTSPEAAFAGVVRCNTVVATNVVGTNYTPGAGNTQ